MRATPIRLSNACWEDTRFPLWGTVRRNRKREVAGVYRLHKFLLETLKVKQVNRFRIRGHGGSHI